MIVWVSGGTVWQRLAIEVNGVVVSSHDTPYKGAPRYGTEYVIRSQDGSERGYIAGPNDGSLQRSLPVGTQIHKAWGELGYNIDGRWINFPTIFYGSTLGIALGCLSWAGLLWKNRPDI
jgi:hypothetical protein